MDYSRILKLPDFLSNDSGKQLYSGSSKRIFPRLHCPASPAHMLIDTGAVLMLVGSDLTNVALLAGAEILISLFVVFMFKHKHIT